MYFFKNIPYASYGQAMGIISEDKPETNLLCFSDRIILSLIYFIAINPFM